MSKSRWCSRNLIRSSIYYALCVRERDFEAELKYLNIAPAEWPQFLSNDHSDASVHHFERRDGGRVVNHSSIVCLRWPAGKTGVEYAGLLVHEAVHLWQRFRSDIGELAPSSEFEAYSIQTIAQELFEQFVMQTKGKR